MKRKPSAEFENFDKVMSGLLAVSYSELQDKLEEENRAKAKKKKRPSSTASRASRVSSSRKKRVA
jgi:hypothetical protein